MRWCSVGRIVGDITAGFHASDVSRPVVLHGVHVLRLFACSVTWEFARSAKYQEDDVVVDAPSLLALVALGMSPAGSETETDSNDPILYPEIVSSNK